jgi:hypothetical protein
LNLVYRSVLNGWDVPLHVRDQISEQMIPAMDFHGNAGDRRSTFRVIKLCKLALLMDVSNRVDAGERKSLHPFGRKRYPERRKPRHLSKHDAAQALERMLTKLATTNPALAERLRASTAKATGKDDGE